MKIYMYVCIFRVILSSTHFHKSLWTLSKYAINSLLQFIDIFSEKGLEFVSKVLSHQYMSFENHGKGNFSKFVLRMYFY